jgi:hypothetical protein
MSGSQPPTRPDAAVRPGADGAAPGLSSPGRVVLTLEDLLWFKTSQDQEGRLTLGLLELSRHSIGVLVDDNGESLGLRLTRTEAQELHRALVAWLASTTG